MRPTWGAHLRRRKFAALFAGTAAAITGVARVRAQKAMPVIGSLNTAGAGPAAPFVAAFQRGLREVGYVEGQNVKVDYVYAEGDYARLPSLAAELVARKVDVIQTSGGTSAALAAKGATSTLPIVSGFGDDPVKDGLVASLARPGGNLTGVSFLAVDLNPKRFELLRELVPGARVIGLLVYASNPNTERVMQEMQGAVRLSGVQLLMLKVSTDNEIDAAFASFVEQKAGALIVPADPFFNTRRDQLMALAARHALPAVYEFRQFASAGGLISYGANLLEVYRQVGVYTGRVLKGAKPADLPVLQPTNFELVINLKTAKALGLTIAPSLVARADEVIE